MNRLKDKVALVTGAGQGIGNSIASAFASQGAIVYITDVSAQSAEQAAEEINRNGGTAHAIEADVTSPGQVEQMFATVVEGHQKLDILVNNAGIHIRTDFRHADEETVEKIFAVNLRGVVRCSRDGFDLLKTSGNACIINLSSIMAEHHVRQLSLYATTKGGVSSLSRALALEYAPFGIRVNYLLPGFIDTDLTKRFTRNPVISKQIIERTPLNRFGSPEDIAKAAVFLASDEASFITGAGITIDGGASITI